MTRLMALMGLALAASVGVALAADLGRGQKRPVREMRSDRALERERPHRAVPALKVVHHQRRGPPYPVNWRGYPQAR